MSERIEWDDFEIALLIDTCEKVNASQLKKAIAVKELSSALRSRAIAQGKNIDSIFRNENGIALQMSKMDYLLSDGAMGLEGASKAYSNLVKMKRENQTQFAELLTKAKKQIVMGNNGEEKMPSRKDLFADWLKTQSKLKFHPQSILSAMEDGSEYVVKHGISKQTFWEIAEAERFDMVCKKLLSMRLFRVTHRQTALLLDKITGYYKSFLSVSLEQDKDNDLPLDNGIVRDSQPSVIEIVDKTEKTNVTFTSEDDFSKPIDCLFGEWLIKHGYSDATSRSYVSALHSADEFAKNHRYTNVNFASLSEKVLLLSIDVLLADKEFAEINRGQHNRYSAAFFKLKECISEAKQGELNKRVDTELETKYPELYRKLYSISKVYDDPNGLSIEQISSLVGGTTSPDVIADFLNRISWATRTSDNQYSFSSNPIMGGKAISMDETKKESTFVRSSLDKVIEYLSSRYDVRVHYDHFSNPGRYNNDLLYKVKNGQRDIIWVYYTTESRYGCYASIETEPEYIQSITDDLNGFTLVQDRASHPCKKLFFTDYEKIKDALRVICDSIDEFFGEKAVVTGNEAKQLEPSDFDKDNFIRVLMARYQSGLQFDSIDFDNFRDTYQDMFNDALTFSDEELELRLKYCGIIYQDRLFPADGIIDPETGKKLFAYIDNSISSGKKVLYYKAIYSDLSDLFAYCFSLTGPDMLRLYVEYAAESGKYYFFNDFLSVDKYVKVDHSAEIRDYYLSEGKPLPFDDVYARLSHIPSDVIFKETQVNPDFLRNEKGVYFHYDIFECSEAEANQISEYLSTEINENGYAIWSKVFETIKDQMPIFLENNLYLSSLGVRNAIGRKLSDRFNFESEVISNIGENLNMSDVYSLYGKHHAPFSSDDVYNFSKELGVQIYFSALAETTVRISQDSFIPKSSIEFDVEAVDRALDTYLSGSYILIKDVDSFLLFPNVGYEWNIYLLESFLRSFSKRYVLLNNGSSLGNVAGAIVKRDGEIKEFVDVCANALASSHIELKTDLALNYLAELNLLTRRSYRELDVALNKARQIRNRMV